ncbi:hypothetical protein PENSPDRAFT_695291 [Peniophora sp. CONT]|nr:hypothetical protein PENSPDRAFT_695291 [Peniophora sp. CONT]
MTLTLYWYFKEDGVVLAKATFDTLSQHGAQALQDEFPTCGDLFLHIAAYVATHHTNATNLPLNSVAHALEDFLKLDNHLELMSGHLPFDCLSSLVPSDAEPPCATFPALDFDTRTKAKTAEARLQQIFLDTLFAVGMSKDLSHLSEVYTRPSRIPAAAKPPLQRANQARDTILIVGSLLDALYHAFGDSDAIFCHPRIIPTLMYADVLLNPRHHSISQLADSIRKDSSSHLERLRTKITSSLRSDPNIISVAKEMSDVVWDYAFGEQASDLVSQLVGAGGRSALHTRCRKAVPRLPWPGDALPPAMPSATVMMGGAEALDMSMLLYIARESIALHSNLDSLDPTAATVFSRRNRFRGQSAI